MILITISTSSSRRERCYMLHTACPGEPHISCRRPLSASCWAAGLTCLGPWAAWHTPSTRPTTWHHNSHMTDYKYSIQIKHQTKSTNTAESLRATTSALLRTISNDKFKHQRVQIPPRGVARRRSALLRTIWYAMMTTTESAPAQVPSAPPRMTHLKFLDLVVDTCN